MSDKTLKTVTLEWSDGTAEQLSGDDAEAWRKQCNDILAFHQVRMGEPLAPSPWKNVAATLETDIHLDPASTKELVLTLLDPPAPTQALREAWMRHDGTTPRISPSHIPPTRERILDERNGKTQKFKINGIKGWFTANDYADGRLAEVFIYFDREGSTLRILADAVATVMSVALQYGVPLKVLAEKFVGVRDSELDGPTRDPKVPRAKSLLDYIARRLLLHYEGVDPVGEPPVPSTDGSVPVGGIGNVY